MDQGISETVKVGSGHRNYLSHSYLFVFAFLTVDFVYRRGSENSEAKCSIANKLLTELLGGKGRIDTQICC